MNTQTNPISEEHLKEAAQKFRYPHTPDVARAVMKRLESRSRPKARLRSAWVVMGLLVLILAVLFAVPSVRAEIIRFFQVGVVRIFPPTPTLTAEPSTPALPLTATPITATPDLITPNPGVNMPFYTVTTEGLAGETSLSEAQAKLPFLILLPAYPADLGEPERVFLQEDGGMILMLWTDPADSESVRLSLHEIAPGKVVMIKYGPHVILETQVNGVRAVWVQGPYLVQLTNGKYDYRRMVEGNTLIWEQEGITYRLESDLSLEETIRIAESIE
jgi:hypothetical protein